MTKTKKMRAAVFLGAIAGLLAARPSAAREFAFNPVLIGNAPSFCGPCHPGPVLLHAAPDSPVLALRFRWSAEQGGFELVSRNEVGITDHQGELRFTLEQGEQSLDKVMVAVGGAVSNGVLFLTNGGCGGPFLCPLPFRLHALTNASAYLPRQPVVVTVTGAAPGSALEIAQEQYVQEGDRHHWMPVGYPALAEADALGQATVILRGARPGVYRAIARDRETGEESIFALYETREMPETLEGIR